MGCRSRPTVSLSVTLPKLKNNFPRTELFNSSTNLLLNSAASNGFVIIAAGFIATRHEAVSPAGPSDSANGFGTRLITFTGALNASQGDGWRGNNVGGKGTLASLSPRNVKGETMTDANKRTYPKGPDNEERERLLTEQLPQVRFIARRIHDRLPRHVPLEDLVHAGVVGLIDALDKYDRDKNVQFGSYAKFRIRGAILDSLRELDWSPRDLRRKARRIGGSSS